MVRTFSEVKYTAMADFDFNVFEPEQKTMEGTSLNKKNSKLS